MQVVALRILRQFWERHAQSEAPIKFWYSQVAKAHWQSPADIKTQLGSTVDFIGDNRVIFDLSGNKYRLVVRVSYSYKRVLVTFVGTHAEYDKIDAETI